MSDSRQLANLKVEAFDIGQRLVTLTPAERTQVIDELHRGAHFCWSCGKDYSVPETFTCHCGNDE